MAGKNIVDNSVAERRLRPVYNWLDDGNNKKAAQEADKVLKKQPNFQCAKVLKGLALLRAGKSHECEQLLESVRKELHCDDATLSAMTICFREMNKPEVICDVYSEAAKKDPKNEELLTHLFMAYVRVCDYKKQQQTAMQLYKLKLKNHYYFWAVMSIVMQAHEAGPELAKNLQLPLAEKMVKKFVEDNKIEAEQEVQLYIMVLEMQNKLEDALAVVEGPLGEMLHSYIVVPTKRVELLVKMKCWIKANIEIKKLLIEDMDNWSLYLDYFKTVFSIIESNHISKPNVESADVINECVKFLTDIQRKNESGHNRLRGPYLAMIEFFVQLQNKGIDPEMFFGYFTDLLLVYFNNFGSKSCCLNDLKPYFNGLTKEQITIFLDEVWKLIELEDGQLPTTKEQMLKYISNLHITRYLGFHEKLDVKGQVQLADCLLRYYIHGAQFNGSNLLPTDIRHNDPFVVLIFEIMNDIWLETNDACYLKNSIMVLEYALNKSPSNHQFKLILIKLYNSLGISKAAHKIYELLDVKHVQLDSMGYLQCWSLLSTGQYFLASHVFETTLKFFTSNYKDSADHLSFLYKFGSFLKINEFIEFRERLNNSLHYSAVTVEKMLLEIFQSQSYQNTIQLIDHMSIHPEQESIQFDKLEDNRDLDLCWTSDPQSRQLSDELVRTSFQNDIDLLKIRSLVLRILGAAVELATKNDLLENGNSDHNCIQKNRNAYESLKILESLVEQAKKLSSSLEQKPYNKLPNNVLNAPAESRLLYVLELSFVDFIITMINTLIVINGDDFEEIRNIPGPLNNPLAKLSETISKLSTECKSSDHTQLNLRFRLLNLLTLIIEMVSIACLICGACSNIVKPSTSHLIKKGKKKKDFTPSAPVNNSETNTMRVKSVQSLFMLTSSVIHDLEACVMFVEDKWHEQVSSDSDISNFMGMLSLEDIGLSELCSVGLHKIVMDSYQSSLSEIHSVLRVKQKFLSELHL